jgi:hypothetical protein
MALACEDRRTLERNRPNAGSQMETKYGEHGMKLPTPANDNVKGAAIRFAVEPRYVPQAKAARRLHLRYRASKKVTHWNDRGLKALALEIRPQFRQVCTHSKLK